MMTKKTNHPLTQSRLDRRVFLCGAGVALTLPWLESWPVRALSPARASSEAPVRFACLFMANGVNVRHWWAEGKGAAMRLGDTLQPLAPFRLKFLVH